MWPIFEIHEIQDEHKLKLATLEFSDYAMKWWHGIVKDIIYHKGPPVDSWNSLKDHMRARFVPPNFRKDLMLCLDLKFTTDNPYCVHWDVGEIWSSNSFDKICNEFFIHHHCHDWKEDSFVCETVWSFSNWILLYLSWILSRFVPYSVGILPQDFNNKFFLENVPQTYITPRLSTFYICEILSYLLQFFSEFILRWKVLKILTQVVSYFVCIQSKSHILK